MTFGVNDSMPSKTANFHHVVAFVSPGVKLLDLAGPLQVFSDAALVTGVDAPYRITIAALQSGPVETDTCVPLNAIGWRDVPRPIHTFLVIGGAGPLLAANDPASLCAIRALAEQPLRAGGRVGSICTGAFGLAATGLLDGRRAVTHWRWCAALAADYPDVLVEPDPIFIEDRGVWTSAGVTAGIDLALAMVAADHGRAAALHLARAFVAYLARPGGQSQFSDLLEAQTKAASAGGRFGTLLEWIDGNLTDDLTVSALAARVAMSERSFARNFAAEVGVTPAKAVERLRVARAQALLETSELPVAEIAARAGFKDDERLRRAFARATGVPPTDYRARFKTDDAD